MNHHTTLNTLFNVVIDQQVEFEKRPVEVEDFMENYRQFLIRNLLQNILRINSNGLDFQTLGFGRIVPKNQPGPTYSSSAPIGHKHLQEIYVQDQPTNCGPSFGMKCRISYPYSSLHLCRKTYLKPETRRIRPPPDSFFKLAKAVPKFFLNEKNSWKLRWDENAFKLGTMLQ